MIKRCYATLALITFALLMGGCQTLVSNPPDGGIPAAPEGDPDNNGDNGIAAYTLKPGDPIYIRFSGVSDQSELNVVIDEKGELNLLHIEEPILAQGLTTSQLENKIERLYEDSGIYVSLSVNVTMTAKPFYVEGEVMRTGKFELTGGITLRQAIVAAGGYTPFADKKKVKLTRQNRVYQFNMNEIEDDPSLDVLIEANDTIKVEEKWY